MSTSTRAIYRGPRASGTGTIHSLRRLAAAILRLGDDRGRARLTTREHAITALLSWGLVAGLYLDGWAPARTRAARRAPGVRHPAQALGVSRLQRNRKPREHHHARPGAGPESTNRASLPRRSS
jgi:hypothetical protein